MELKSDLVKQAALSGSKKIGGTVETVKAIEDELIPLTGGRCPLDSGKKNALEEEFISSSIINGSAKKKKTKKIGTKKKTGTKKKGTKKKATVGMLGGAKKKRTKKPTAKKGTKKGTKKGKAY